MRSPLALVIDDDPKARERARETLARAGIEAVAVASPREALDVLRAHDDRTAKDETILGRSEAADGLRHRLRELATAPGSVLFTGEAGSGRNHAARRLHALSGATGSFVAIAGDDPAALAAALAKADGTVFVSAIERIAWPAQEALASAMTAGRLRPRLMASTALDPRAGADEGRVSPALMAAFGDGVVRVPALRERSADIAVLAAAFTEELKRLNRLPSLTLAPEAGVALNAYLWPGNVRQLRNAIESAVILASEETVRARDLPEFLRSAAGAAAPEARADRRFRDAKRSVVEAFERAYLADLLKRHGGNVTGAAEQSGMLRSALQRLLRKHDLHSADFRGRGAPGPYAS